MLKIFHVDIETTGDDPNLHSIHQIGGYIEIDNKVVNEFEYNVRPYPTALINTKALLISGVTKEEIMNYRDAMSVIREICNLIELYIDYTNPQDKFFISGYNAAHFEGSFLPIFFMQNGCSKYKNYFYHAILDTMVLAASVLRYERSTMPDFKLPTVARRFDIDVNVDRLHKAKYDAWVSMILLTKISNSKA